MEKMHEIGRKATNVFSEEGYIKVVYHFTCVVKWNEKEIILDTGGWYTQTTKNRMNQASNQFGLDYTVFQREGKWYVMLPNMEIVDFENGMRIKR